ncbi:MAG: hypothetical protein GX334_08290 [Firmicutes bacterium]|nr:hypothetical protein [Bacillota bacterium]
MENRERRFQQRITRRKEKVQRMIKAQQTKLAALDAVTYLREEDYRQALKRVREKLYRLQQELRGLEAGLLRWKV